MLVSVFASVGMAVVISMPATRKERVLFIRIGKRMYTGDGTVFSDLRKLYRRSVYTAFDAHSVRYLSGITCDG